MLPRIFSLIRLGQSQRLVLLLCLTEVLLTSKINRLSCVQSSEITFTLFATVTMNCSISSYCIARCNHTFMQFKIHLCNSSAIQKSGISRVTVFYANKYFLFWKYRFHLYLKQKQPKTELSFTWNLLIS